MNDWKCWRNREHPVAPHPQLGWPQCTVCGAAPQYHERAQYLPAGMELTLYAPAFPEANLGIAPGSAIVGVPLLDDGPQAVLVCYEGWVHGAMQYADRDAHGRWEAGVEHAADRLITAYPSVARKVLPIHALRPIGTYSPTTNSIAVTDDAALVAWLGEDR